MATGERCTLCNKFMERGEEEFNNGVELEATHRELDNIYYFFMCQECAKDQEVENK